MTSAEILSEARLRILRLHGPTCAQQRLWHQLARLLGDAEARATALEEAHGVDVIDDQLILPLAVATAYLDLATTDHAKEHAHTGGAA